MPDRPTTNVSTRALEVFATLASTGSLQDTARALGMSASTASQQIRKLEAALGYTLIDHARRPLEPTQAGYTYLVHVREALGHLRQGAIAASLTDLASLQRLRLGIIDDFDSEVSPRLIATLVRTLARCELSLLTAPSNHILTELAAGTLDFGVAARPDETSGGIVEAPLLRDPFVIAVPRGKLSGPPSSLQELAELPFLRYGEQHFLGRQIAAELAWRRLTLPGRISLDSNQAMFGLIAAGEGWTITTPLGFSSARRFRNRVELHPLPFTGFTRVISLYRADGWSDDVLAIIAGSLRESLRERIVEPNIASRPWLADALTTVS